MNPLPFALLISITLTTPIWCADTNSIYTKPAPDLVKTEKQLQRDYRKHQQNQQTLREIGIIQHQLATLGEKNYSFKAVETLKMAYSQTPSDNEILAYLGSATTMMARDSWNIFTKQSDLKAGLEMIDAAVKNDPENLTVRLIRAYNGAKLPDFANRKSVAKSDFLKAEDIISKAEKPVDPAIYAKVCYQLGVIHKSEGNDDVAQLYFKKAARLEPSLRSGQPSTKEIRQ